MKVKAKEKTKTHKHKYEKKKNAYGGYTVRKKKHNYKKPKTSKFERELIKTTVPKAKELRSFIEPLITMAKDDSVANRRRAFNKLRLDSAVNKLFTEIAIKSKDRPGGYLRIIKAGFRPGDKADMEYVCLLYTSDAADE